MLLVRHGKTAFNQGSDEKSRLKGTTFDLPLTDEGHKEAERVANVVSQLPVGAIRHSGMLRSVETAKHIEQATGKQSTEDDGLDPWDVGYLAGHTRAMAKRRIEYYIRNPHKAVPDGTSYDKFFSAYEASLARELKEAEKLIQYTPIIRGQHFPDIVARYLARVLVTHSCNAAATSAILEGGEPEFHSENLEMPGGILKLEQRGGKWHMEEMEA